MWLNESEQYEFGPFADYVHRYEKGDFLFLYADGTELVVHLYIDEYESDNGLDLADANYEEYWEMAFEVREVLADEKNLFSVGSKVLVNYHTIPKLYQTR